ncbi:hypothetical protein [Winogradskyella luteola]|uniref:Uncharacterized protein n=1 Tax=Winogradskyella luteola TaxID=2828330 RepID=A0A9X1F823_9FLAO|nr:hypothetical protein [Winogradskyella luteola]MBV7268173.1 hypothetical protein [Winogradskyella luteola]
MRSQLNNTVLVFKTSVENNKDISRLQPILNTVMTKNDFWNFDLEDCDNILRIETNHLQPESVLGLLGMHGFYCEELR